LALLRQVAEVLRQERGALDLDEQVRLLLASLRHDSASVQATAVQARAGTPLFVSNSSLTKTPLC
jgi:hypothetical protein